MNFAQIGNYTTRGVQKYSPELLVFRLLVNRRVHPI